MSLESALDAYLTAHAGVNAIVVGRIFQDTVPQGTVYPALSYQRISTNRVRRMKRSGVSGLSRLAAARVQINCWAKGNGTQVQALAAAVRSAMDAFSGDQADITVQGSHHLDEKSVPDKTQSTQVNKLYKIMIDYRIWHAEAAPV